MKIKLLFSVLAITVGLTAVNQANAQDIEPIVAPVGLVGWNSPASLCQTMPGSAQSSVDYAVGAVSFAPGASGTIGLICHMPGVMNGVDPKKMTGLALSFSNPNAPAGCDVSVYMVDRTTGAATGEKLKSGNFQGVWTANLPISQTVGPPVLPPVLNHTHDVDVYLSRSQTAGESCNPVAFGMFLTDYYILF